MKKNIILSFIIGISSIVSPAIANYIPTRGPLQLHDVSKDNLGVITATLRGNNDLQQELTTIQAFSRLFPQAKTYQNIVQTIQHAQSPLGYQALEALENVIMYIYHEKAFAVYIPYDPCLPVQGLRYTWLNPLTYIQPQYWLSDSNEELDQLINELDQLATVAMSKNPILATRMKATVHTYRHWRKYILATIIGYFAQDTYRRDGATSTLSLLLHGDKKASLKNIKDDVYKACSCIYSCGSYLLSSSQDKKKFVTWPSSISWPSLLNTQHI